MCKHVQHVQILHPITGIFLEICEETLHCSNHGACITDPLFPQRIFKCTCNSGFTNDMQLVEVRKQIIHLSHIRCLSPHIQPIRLSYGKQLDESEREREKKKSCKIVTWSAVSNDPELVHVGIKGIEGLKPRRGRCPKI